MQNAFIIYVVRLHMFIFAEVSESETYIPNLFLFLFFHVKVHKSDKRLLYLALC